MAQTETPAPAERIAVLLAIEFPGRESIIDCAFFLGSSEGTLEAYRIEVNGVLRDGRDRIESVGRSLVAPVVLLASSLPHQDLRVLPAALLANLDAIVVNVWSVSRSTSELSLTFDAGRSFPEVPWRAKLCLD